MRKFLWLSSLLPLALIISCGPDLDALRKETQSLAAKLDQDFETMKNAVSELDLFVENLYAHKEDYDLSTAEMDDPKGPFKFLDKVFYYKDKDELECVVAATGAVPVDQRIKASIRLLENARGQLIVTKKKSPAIAISWILTKDSVGLAYPSFDYLSAIPQKLDLSQMFWFKMASPEVNPAKSAVWTQEPFVDLAGRGWFKTIASPIYDGSEFIGIATSDAVIKDVIRTHLAESKAALFVVSGESLLLGQSKLAAPVLGLKVLEDFDYLKQMKDNAFAPDAFKLSYGKNPPEIRAVGESLSKGVEFELPINGKKYHFVVSKAAEPGFFVVGMSPL